MNKTIDNTKYDITKDRTEYHATTHIYEEPDQHQGLVTKLINTGFRF